MLFVICTHVKTLHLCFVKNALVFSQSEARIFNVYHYVANCSDKPINTCNRMNTNIMIIIMIIMKWIIIIMVSIIIFMKMIIVIIITIILITREHNKDNVI